jgi:3-oxoacyl-[acyl-carrier-protein] synthase I
MSAPRLAVLRSGMVTALGLTAPATCAALRAGLTNPTESRFVDAQGEWIMSYAVPLTLQGRAKLVSMASAAIEECLDDVPREDWKNIALLLCVAERTRAGRCDGLEDVLLAEITERLGGEKFAPQSGVLPYGRVSCAVALRESRKLLQTGTVGAVLIVAVDSLISAATLRAFEKDGRVLTPQNSDGFIPGEGACALLIGAECAQPHLSISGLGFATESAFIGAEQPLRADGLTAAVSAALADAGCAMHDLDFRITDVSGEHYYFKEAALVLLRTLRQRKEEFDFWHPAEGIGETGSVIGPGLLAVASAAGRGGYAPGNAMLLHAANDSGERAAIIAQYVTGHV